MNKPWIAVGLLALLIVMPMSVSADALSDAFDSLSAQTNNPGYFKSQVRNSVSFGSGRLRFQSQAPARPLGINIVPPSLNVGCNGIDWHFGGLSWVNGKNIERMLQAAGPAALMYVIKLSINALCEDCAEELGKVVQALQKAANASMNSCQLGQGLVDSGVNAASDQFCKNGSAQMGEADNFSAARKICKGQSLFHLKDLGFVETINSQAQKISQKTNDLFSGLFSGNVNALDQGTSAAKLQNNKMLNLDNKTWEALKRSGIVMDAPDIRSMHGNMSETQARQAYSQSIAIGELFMSMMGATSATGPENGNTDPGPASIGATLDSQTMLTLLECGTNYFNGTYTDARGHPLSAQAKRVVQKECDGKFKGRNSGTSGGTINAAVQGILTCGGKGPGSGNLFGPNADQLRYERCNDVQNINLGEWATRGYVQDTIANGTLGMAVARLYSISRKIQGLSGTTCTGNTNVSQDASAGTTTLCPREIALLQNAPFPLYKVVNLAALFPGLRPQLFDVYGRILGLMLADQYLVNYVQAAGQYASKQSAPTAPARQVNREINKQLDSIQTELHTAVDSVGKQLKRAQILTSQIQSLEQNLRNDIFDRQILGNQAFSQSVSAAAYNGSSNPNGTP